MQDPIVCRRKHTALTSRSSEQCIVLLPGFGYTFDRPLLRGARTLALQAGCACSNFPLVRCPMTAKMKGHRALCAADRPERAKAILDQLSYARRLWIAKSFGTIVAGMLRQGAGALFMLTPLRQTFPISMRMIWSLWGSGPFLDEEDLGWLKQCPAAVCGCLAQIIRLRTRIISRCMKRSFPRRRAAG